MARREERNLTPCHLSICYRLMSPILELFIEDTIDVDYVSDTYANLN